MKRVVVYKLDNEIPSQTPKFEELGLKPIFWHPSFTESVPPRKPKKYFIYWLFHYLRIFKNRNYSSLFIFKDDKIISSILIVPAHFKWPFMDGDDIQFTYVMTDPAYRGKGIAEKALRFAINKFHQPGRTFWYVTDTENKSSIKLCSKINFTFVSNGKSTRFLNILKLE